MRTLMPSPRRRRWRSSSGRKRLRLGANTATSMTAWAVGLVVGEREVGVRPPGVPALDLAAHPQPVLAAADATVDQLGQLADRVRALGVDDRALAARSCPSSKSSCGWDMTAPSLARLRLGRYPSAASEPRSMTRRAGALSPGSSPANSGSTGIARCWRSDSSWRSGRSSARSRVVISRSNSVCTLVEVAADLLGGLDVLAPLLVERADETEDLVARLLDHEVVERLADDAEEGEQRERRAHHDALAEGIVEQRRIVLVDEAGELLVGQEQQDVVDGRLGALALRTRAWPAP